MLCRATTTRSSSSSSRWIDIRTSRVDMSARAARMLHRSSKCARERRTIVVVTRRMSIRFARRTSRVRPANVVDESKNRMVYGMCQYWHLHSVALDTVVLADQYLWSGALLFLRLSPSANTKSTSAQSASEAKNTGEESTSHMT